MRAVIYARYSCDNQREESIEGQLRECKEFAERKGYTLVGSYIDRAVSAKTDNRPEFQRMVKESAGSIFDVVIVWKLDRFARNRYDSAHYKAALRKNGVKVVSATEVISEGAEGIILESVLEGYAEYYSAELSEKVIRGMTENALKCKYNGGSIPVGYKIDKDHHYTVDELVAPFVKEAFLMYAGGKKIKDIVEYLDETHACFRVLEVRRVILIRSAGFVLDRVIPRRLFTVFYDCRNVNIFTAKKCHFVKPIDLNKSSQHIKSWIIAVINTLYVFFRGIKPKAHCFCSSLLYTLTLNVRQSRSILLSHFGQR